MASGTYFRKELRNRILNGLRKDELEDLLLSLLDDLEDLDGRLENVEREVE